ncbi:MAG: acyl-CoA dehydrogenase family protein [Alphaproteobacteria bacterium]|nr:acyl-CoA dehydrogenase family protein [Alphaproteobacteria bacterium]
MVTCRPDARRQPPFHGGPVHRSPRTLAWCELEVWITCAHVADYLVVVCKTDLSAARHSGMSILLVDAKAPGVRIRPLKMLGRRTTHANEVFFENVRTPATRVRTH